MVEGKSRQAASRGLAISLAIAFVCLLTQLSATGPASAAVSCTFSPPAVAFGTISTSSNQNYDLSSTTTISCSSGTANGLAYVCVYNQGSNNGGAGNNGPYYMVNGSQNLNYNVYLDAAYSSPFGLSGAISMAISLNSSGAGSQSFTLYYRVPSGQGAVPTGSYSTVLSLALDTFSSPSCSGLVGAMASNVAVSASNQGGCTVSGGTLNFGSVGLLSSNVDQAATITPTCSSGVSYTISLDGGQHGGTSATNRKMVNGANSVTYGLFTDAARSSGWYGASVGGTGTGSAQSFTVYGRVAPQSTPPPATYTDTVVITVTF